MISQKLLLKRLAGVLALAALYFCAGKLGLLLAFVNASVSPVWPPTGIALAALLLWGYRLWPGIFLGALLVNITTPETSVADLGIAAGNTLEALMGVWLVNRYAHGAKVFDRAYDIFKYVVLAAMLSTAVSATLGVTSLCLGREARWEQYPAIWSTWWLGDMLGALTVTPLLLIWVTQRFSRPEPRRAVEGAGLAFAVVLGGLILFVEPIPLAGNNQFKYLAILPLLWAAFRFGQRGAIASVAALSGLALWGTLHGVGPFVTADESQSLLLLQAFVSTISVMALVVAAAVSEREQLERRLQVQNAISRVLAESSTLKEAAPQVIQALCETGGWDLGAVWNVDRAANQLCCVELWRPPAIEVSEFEAITRRATFAPGIGLPGRVWSNGTPEWISDVTLSNSPRASLALKEGLHAGFCFPIKLGDEVLGVLECFARQVREPDEDFLRMLDNIGRQLGQFIVHQHAEESRLEMSRRLRAAQASAKQAEEEVEKQVAARRQVEEALGRWANAPLPQETHSRLWRYGASAAAVGCALLLRLLLDPILGNQATLVTAYGSVAFAVWYGGQGPALFACVVSYLGANWMFIEPRYVLGFDRQDVIGLSLYLLSNFVVIAVGERMRRAERQANAGAVLAIARQREVEAEMQERKRAEQTVRESEQQARRELKEMFLLQDLSQRLVPSVDMRSLLERVLDVAIAITHTEMGDVQLFDPKSGALNVTAKRGLQIPFVDFFAEVHHGQTASDSLMRRGERLIVEDVSKVFAGSPAQQALLDAGVRAAQSTPLFSRSGQLVGMISTYFGQPHRPEARQVQLLDLLARQAADFIDRCQAEEALRQNEERMRVILDTALDAVVTIDEQGRIVFWNSQAEKTFGWTQAEAFGRKLSDTIIPPRFREAHERGLRRYFETGFGPVLNRRIEMIALHRDGRQFPVELAIAPVVVEDHVHFSAFIRDITERKQVEERLRLVVEAAPNAMVMASKDGRIAMVNAQAENLFGYNRKELLGEAMEMLVPERFRSRHPGMRLGFFTASQTRPMEAGEDWYGLRKDGREVPIDIGLSPIETAEGPFVLASIVDITERKRAEERLRSFNAELERRVEEHTAELSENAARLRASLREREVLLQETHHRVKNNLQIVASLLSLQSADIRDPQLVAHFQESQGRIHSMALIHEKLYQSESLARVDLAEYMHSLVDILFRTYLANDNVSLDVRFDPAPVSIDTAVPMGLLLNELVTNALKYAFPNGRTGCLLVALEAKPDGELVLRVEDDGVGMAPDFQLERAKTLGLRLVQMLAKQLRGEVAFHSESGHTEFEIRFQEPAAKSA